MNCRAIVLCLLCSSITLAVDKSVQPFAVVELFTSEGCSSCPPAEHLANDLVTIARKNKQRIYVLAFHVDYWDYLGWPDRFAHKDYTARQRQYATAWRTRQIYTPQSVVNGVGRGFVGSNRTSLNQNVATALKQPPPVELTIGLAKETVKSKAPKDDPNPPAQITYKVKDTKDTDVLNVALVERGLKTKVLRGENRGRSLTQENVVRWFNTVKIHRTAQGRVTVPLPKDLNKSNASIIAYVQDSKTMLIRGADRVDMTQPKPAK